MKTQTNTIENNEIRLTREFDAPGNMVFDAWTDAEKIRQWWGPNGFTTTTKKMDFKVGGEWIFIMHGPDGTDYPNHIVYKKIVEPEYLEYDHYGDKNAEEKPHFKTTVKFIDKGEKTKVNMRMEFPTAEARNEAAEFGAVEGGNQTLNRLEKFLTRGHPHNDN